MIAKRMFEGINELMDCGAAIYLPGLGQGCDQ